MPEDKKTCFIIMPITTPKDLVERYDNDADHFKHVLEHLHIPAVESAGYEPIPPIAQGADLIHAEIIRNLETSDLVLCDISTLNPNVFFELGVRTSLNKPVCYVKDEFTKKIPFDTGILNHKEYHSTIRAWDIKVDIPTIAEHLQTSFERSKNENTLWRHFGIRSKAKSYERKEGEDGKFGEIMFVLDNIQERIDSLEGRNPPKKDISIQSRAIHRAIELMPSGTEVIFSGYRKNSNEIRILYSGIISSDYMKIIIGKIFKEYGIRTKLVKGDPKIDVCSNPHEE